MAAMKSIKWWAMFGVTVVGVAASVYGISGLSAQSPAPPQVVGTSIVGNGQGGAASTFSAQGQSGQGVPSIGGRSDAIGCEGQTVIGTSVVQNGPAIGLVARAENGGVGYVSTATSRPCN